MTTGRTEADAGGGLEVALRKTTPDGKVTLPDRFSAPTHGVGNGVTRVLHNSCEGDDEVISDT